MRIKDNINFLHNNAQYTCIINCIYSKEKWCNLLKADFFSVIFEFKLRPFCGVKYNLVPFKITEPKL